MRKIFTFLLFGVSLLVKANCPFSEAPIFNSYTDTSATITWEGTGTFEIEYGLYPYPQGGGGIVLPDITSTTQQNTFTIENLTPGKAYSVYFRKKCNSNETSVWLSLLVGTSISSIITQLPYIENFNLNGRAFMINYGWTPVTSPNLPWRASTDNSEPLGAMVSMCDWQGGIVDRTIYSRPIQLIAGQSYKINFDYSINNLLPAAINNADMNVLINTEISNQGAIILSSIEDISNEQKITHELEFTAQTNGIHYIGIQGVFQANPIQDPNYSGYTGFNWLNIDNFFFQEQPLNITDINKEHGVKVYPNPFNNHINIFSENHTIQNIQIYDLKGSLIHSEEYNINEIQINLSNLNTGVYLLKVTSEEGISINKIIK